jgi:uncharacterized membrane protein
MGIDVTVQATINRPREEVARYATRPENEPVWISGIQSSQLLTDPPVRVGTQVARVAAFLGRRIDYVLRVIEHDPARVIAMETVRGPFPMKVTYHFADAPGGTLAQLRVEGEAGTFYRIAGPLMSGAVRRSLSKDLANLKTILERGAAT